MGIWCNKAITNSFEETKAFALLLAISLAKVAITKEVIIFEGDNINVVKALKDRSSNTQHGSWRIIQEAKELTKSFKYGHC